MPPARDGGRSAVDNISELRHCGPDERVFLALELLGLAHDVVLELLGAVSGFLPFLRDVLQLRLRFNGAPLRSRGG